MTNTIFLCGVGRSGTTIFRTALGRHPEIYYNGMENNVVQELIHVAQKNCSMPSRRFAMVVDQDRYDQIFRQTIESLIWPDPELADRPVRLAAINPTGDQLDYLRQVFPGSKFICLVRNGIEVVSSRTQYPSFAQQTFESHCRVWNRSRSVVDWGSRNSDDFRLFRQEWFYQPDLLKAQLGEFFQWASITPDQDVYQHVTGTLRHPTGDLGGDETIEVSADQFANASPAKRREYFESKRNRWQYWDTQQKESFVAECGDFMRQLGYEVPW